MPDTVLGAVGFALNASSGGERHSVYCPINEYTIMDCDRCCEQEEQKFRK